MITLKTLVRILLSGIWLNLLPPMHLYAEYRVRNVEFKGNNTLKKNQIRESTVLRDFGFWDRLPFGNKPQRYSEQILQQDINRIRRLYQSSGFLQIHIGTELVRYEENNWIDIRFIIQEGAPVKVQNVNFTLADTINTRLRNDLYKKASALNLLQGDRFQDEDLKADQRTLVRFMNNQGYAYAQIRPRFELNHDSSGVDIMYHISSGPLCRFNRITVQGNDHIPDKIIYNQMVVQPGDQYSEQKLQKSQRRIYNLGAFQYVTVKAQLEDSLDTELDVSINLKEADRMSTRLGFGYGREDQFRTFVRLEKIGLFYPASQTFVFIKRSALTPYQINLRWHRPAVFHPQASISLSSFIRREKEPAYSADRYGGALSYHRIWSPNFTTSVNHTLEQVQLDLSKATQDITRDTLSLYNKSITRLHAVYDDSKPALSPAQGGLAGLNLDWSGFESTYQYFKFDLELRRYFRLPAELTGAVKVKYGFIQPVNDNHTTPIEERFFAGGGYSIRGWSRADLGPKNKEGKPIGGKNRLETSLELRFPLYKRLSGVLFFDAGNVWQTPFFINIQNLGMAAGSGLRLGTPIGPVRIDMGVPLNLNQTGVQIHFSVGHSF